MKYVGNFKNAIYNRLKDEKLKKNFAPVLMAGPLLLLETNANIDISFDSYDELKDHPMAQTLMVSYKQLFGGIIGGDLDEAKEPTDLSDIPEDKQGSHLY